MFAVSLNLQSSRSLYSDVGRPKVRLLAPCCCRAAAGLLLRLFMIQHRRGSSAFFRHCLVTIGLVAFHHATRTEGIDRSPHNRVAVQMVAKTPPRGTSGSQI